MNETRNFSIIMTLKNTGEQEDTIIAVLVDKNGLVFRAYDVGRHNAVDKIVDMAI